MVSRHILVVLLGVVGFLGSGCLGGRPVEVPPDERFGHRFEERGPEGRRTLHITPPDSALTYDVFPIVYDTVHIRVGRPEGNETAVPVEVLVKGAFPDACMELHDVRQQRAAHLIEVEITMRKPRGAVCAAVLRPYRFYFMLEGRYEPGAYTLKINGRAHPFSVRPVATETS
ncbi:MAG: hypothetical protein KatS3mg042_1315 [Rhodothermaceae bacterium]|nr:MAG: hypothetical protein KatS3mg042_1315 [Rhodothermaceae bacterium]